MERLDTNDVFNGSQTSLWDVRDAVKIDSALMGEAVDYVKPAQKHTITRRLHALLNSGIETLSDLNNRWINHRALTYDEKFFNDLRFEPGSQASRVQDSTLRAVLKFLLDHAGYKQIDMGLKSSVEELRIEYSYLLTQLIPKVEIEEPDLDLSEVKRALKKSLADTDSLAKS